MVYCYLSFTCTHESMYLTLLKKRKLTSDSWTMNISISACLVVKFNYPITIKFFMCLRALMHFHWLVNIQQLLLKRKVHCWLKHHGPKIDWIFFMLSAFECLIDKVFLINNVKLNWIGDYCIKIIRKRSNPKRYTTFQFPANSVDAEVKCKPKNLW